MEPDIPPHGGVRAEIRKAMDSARPMSRQMCLQCKGGRLLCGRDNCPLLQKIDFKDPIENKLKERMFGPSTSVFVGWKDYPNVYVGPMTSIDKAESDRLDNPGSWYGLGFDDIVRMRSLLVRAKQKHPVLERGQFVSKMQELALSVKPVDVETQYVRKPTFSMSFSPVSQPMGASGQLKDLTIAENPVIPHKVDYVVSDDLSSSDQLASLFERNFDVYYLANVLSSGALGQKQGKKMVPTRWSITAVDDTLGKRLMSRIRNFPTIGDIQVFENTYLENHFEVLLIPGGWEFEQFEAWSANTLWTMAYDEPQIVQEYEAHEGRSDYAINEGGGYYAGRFAAAEALDRMGRQARCVIFREIYESYVLPVGVWEVRENVRKALAKKPLKFGTLKEALTNINSRLTLPIRKYIEKSQILKQRRITDYN
jgi:DNA repair protein NreA